MEIRKATLKDKDQIIKLVKKFYSRSSPKTVKAWEKTYKRIIKLIFVAEINKKIVGFIACSTKQNSIYIDDLYVLKKYRKKGVATSLMKFISSVKKRLKKKYIIGNVRRKDKPAIRFYKKIGFKIYETKNKRLRIKK